MSQKDGGPAFASPQFAVPENLREEHIMLLRSLCGMSMRQYYKAKAMQGLLSNPHFMQNAITFREEPDSFITKQASCMADEMLAEDIEHATRQED